jgi:hypothetical protein
MRVPAPYIWHIMHACLQKQTHTRTTSADALSQRWRYSGYAGPVHPLLVDNVNMLKTISRKAEVSFHMSGTSLSLRLRVSCVWVGACVRLRLRLCLYMRVHVCAHLSVSR